MNTLGIKSTAYTRAAGMYFSVFYHFEITWSKVIFTRVYRPELSEKHTRRAHPGHLFKLGWDYLVNPSTVHKSLFDIYRPQMCTNGHTSSLGKTYIYNCSARTGTRVLQGRHTSTTVVLERAHVFSKEEMMEVRQSWLSHTFNPLLLNRLIQH